MQFPPSAVPLHLAVWLHNTGRVCNYQNSEDQSTKNAPVLLHVAIEVVVKLWRFIKCQLHCYKK